MVATVFPKGGSDSSFRLKPGKVGGDQKNPFCLLDY